MQSKYLSGWKEFTLRQQVMGQESAQALSSIKQMKAGVGLELAFRASLGLLQSGIKLLKKPG